MQYDLQGGVFPVVVCHLKGGESMITESGSMAWMSPNIRMETTGGGIGKMLGKAISGEKMFQNIYTAVSDGMIAFGSSFPGKIIPLQISPGHEMIVQKSAFLASEPGVELSVFFRKRMAAGFFGGEGFIMQRLSGSGTAFIEIDGEVIEYSLAPGQQLIVDTGNLAAMDVTVRMDVQAIQGVKNVLLGGEGLFNTVVTGPGRVWLQTMPISGIAAVLSGNMTANH